MDLYEKIVQVRSQGGRAALATIVRRLGSTPRKDAAKMLILSDGSSVGTVGGGCVEAEVWQKADEVIRTGRPSLARFELNAEDAENEGLVCGGIVDIFIEPIMSDPKLVILGAGHLGQAICHFAKPLGFEVTVIDDREMFADPKRFPEADSIIITPFEQAFANVKPDANTFVLIVTRGHRHDQAATEAAIQTPSCYIGLVGSRRKIKIIVESLLKKGFDPGVFKALYAPIGLPIGSETPEEIAVSVVAELIAHRKGVHQRSEKQLFALEVIDKWRAEHAVPATDQP